MEDQNKQYLAEYLIAMGDDELILGHRNSEWCGHAPILEEDIAFANIAVDEIGHARVWYSLAAKLLGEDVTTYPDKLVFFRNPTEYRSIQLVSLGNGDWANTILRQYLLDAYEMVHLTYLAKSNYAPLAEAVKKVQNEEIYHLRHSIAWVQRLGLGTDESHQRMQTALTSLWPYAQELTGPMPHDKELSDAGLLLDSKVVRLEWETMVKDFLSQTSLPVPEELTGVSVSRLKQPDILIKLVTEMQEVARLESQAVRW
ncbi:MAG: phenylacetate-CoA oxygenase subunit PaaC [Chloroflexota bacterium]